MGRKRYIELPENSSPVIVTDTSIAFSCCVESIKSQFPEILDFNPSPLKTASIRLLGWPSIFCVSVVISNFSSFSEINFSTRMDEGSNPVHPSVRGI
ncbi:hypothetical protein OVS_03175 [Mycoplasma ovis str. Michigan]|uniref:Uncharacterized protein n=1 Tax=Mycoplasma ovis str. Michigan TaxID=1415773 RepID=A0ABN4BS62_9MOLU|nr:hypothetical protein OVS_03175 [Mycoplasma ovis str. Michigan]